MPLPTLVIAGAQKCGTSSLAATLRRHPQVFMARPKELHFFDRHFDRGLDWYREQFTPRRGHVHAGEATPNYLYHPDARRRIPEVLPDAKIVVILRDPAKRAYSHYWHSRRIGGESLDFETALDRETERITAGDKVSRSRHSYTDRGHYLEQLEPFAADLGRDRLHVMLLEDLIGDRVPTLITLFDFLGIETEQAASIEEQWTNRYRVAEEPGGKPKPVAYPPLDPDTRKRLIEHFKPHNDRLAAWLGRDLSVWDRP